MTKLTIYTDGSCKGNPGPGGYASIIREKGRNDIIISGRSIATTNNRMEIMGVLAALETRVDPCEIQLYTDSRYIVDSVNKKWVYGWEKKNWIKSDGNPTLNPELWKRILVQIRKHKVTFIWVKGHANNEFNNKCDEIAVYESTKAAEERDEFACK